METDYPPFVHNDQGERSASIIQIDNGKTIAAVAICAAFAALGVGFSTFAVYTAQQAAMEARVFQEKANKLTGELEALKEARRGY
jgi:hypothetical protein